MEEEKVPIINNIIDNRESYKKVHKPENKDLFTKEEMDKKDKKAIQRKIKKIKKSKALRIKEKE